MSKPLVAASAAIGSTDIAAPTPPVGNTVRGAGNGKATTLFYAFTAGPGTLTLTGDGKNRQSAFVNALKLTLQDTSTRPLCNLTLGNVTREERKVVSCTNPAQQVLVLRVDLAPETIAWRATVEGPALSGSSSPGGDATWIHRRGMGCDGFGCRRPKLRPSHGRGRSLRLERGEAVDQLLG